MVCRENLNRKRTGTINMVTCMGKDSQLIVENMTVSKMTVDKCLTKQLTQGEIEKSNHKHNHVYAGSQMKQQL